MSLTIVDGAGATKVLATGSGDGSGTPFKTPEAVQLEAWDSTSRAKVAQPADVIDATLSLDTSAYASGDVLADTQAVTGVFRTSGGQALLQSVTLIDLDDQGVALTLVFLRANSSLGTENSAPDIDDTEVLDVLGTVAVGTGDYVDLGGARVATIKNVGLMLEPTTGTSLYVGAINGAGTPTFTASGLRLRLGVQQF